MKRRKAGGALGLVGVIGRDTDVTRELRGRFAAAARESGRDATAAVHATFVALASEVARAALGGVEPRVDEGALAWHREVDDRRTRGLLAEVATRLRALDLPALPAGRDLLGDLYQDLVAPARRRARGEFFTPAWLVDETLAAAARRGANLLTDRALDPCCGTGRFLLALLARRLAAGVPAREALEGVAGTDVTLASAIAARLNLLVCAGARAAEDGLRPSITCGDVVLEAAPGAARVELVVGNPPWLAYGRLPAAWRRRAAVRWRALGLFHAPGATRPHASDLSVLVAAVALAERLVPGGRLAFVMPRAVASADPGNRAFRQYRAGDVPFRVEELVDLSGVQPFAPDASGPAVILIARAHATTIFPVPGARWTRAGREAVEWRPIGDAASALAWWRAGERRAAGDGCPYAFGKGCDTRGANGILMVEALAPVDARGLVRVANVPALGRDARVPRREGLVEAELLVPLVRGADVSAMAVAPARHYLLLAHDPGDRARPLDEAALRARPGAWRFLRAFRARLARRAPYLGFRPAERAWWQVQGAEHMDAGHLVCVREIAGRPAAAVVSARWDELLGRRVLPVPGHKLLFHRTGSAAEARYLAAALNAPAMQDRLARYASFTALSPRALARLPITRFSGRFTCR